MMANRIKIAGVWYDLEAINKEYPLSRLHSVEYEGGWVYQFAFGSSTLEIDRESAAMLLKVANGIAQCESS